MATKRMLIDATHSEETRVVVLSGNRLDELDVESSSRKQLKGNIYLAKVTRVEPSLQAAFVDYGGNRHGFLPFDEIHPDYFQIPVADRESLLAEDERDDEDDDEQEAERESAAAPAAPSSEPAPEALAAEAAPAETSTAESGEFAPAEADQARPEGEAPATEPSPVGAESRTEEQSESDNGYGDNSEADAAEAQDAPRPPKDIETLGGDDSSDDEDRKRRHISHRHYKIQEVIKRRQILLVQVVKEERGNKGAALTTYMSLAGRYCVLMPNTARGGGISRKIASGADRRRLKSLLSDLEMPKGMAVIVRTAGQERSKTEIRRDYEYLMRLWSQVRETTLQSTAPCLVYEEANLIKRAIRDLYANDVEEILVDGEDGYRAAKDFMKMLIPSHAKKVQPYKEPGMPLFHRFQVENQLDAMHSPVVQLRSGGYIVINPTEALVAIDVNSGRATRERNIEETALKTNVEAAEEIARQLRLRDLAGLIVIDFIDMESSRNQNAVERRLKEAMRHDRARIQIGRISAFGLLELSRQRLRPSLTETSTEPCPFCQGTGVRRSVESTALHILRAIEEEGVRRRTAELVVHVPTDVALYILNHKRAALESVEQRYGLSVLLSRDDTLVAPNHRMERLKTRHPQDGDTRPVVPEDAAEDAPYIDRSERVERSERAETEEERTSEEGVRRRRRRRRRRGGREDGRGDEPRSAETADMADGHAEEDSSESGADAPVRDEDNRSDGEGGEGGENPARKRRRRGKRGGRHRRRDNEDGTPAEAAEPRSAGDVSGEPGEETEDGEREGGPRRRRRRRGGRDRHREGGAEREEGSETTVPESTFSAEPMPEPHDRPEPAEMFVAQEPRFVPPIAAHEPPPIPVLPAEPLASEAAAPEPKDEPLPPPPAGVVVKASDGSVDVIQPEASRKGWWRRG